jgi:hypothetical protein
LLELLAFLAGVFDILLTLSVFWAFALLEPVAADFFLTGIHGSFYEGAKVDPSL